MAAVLTELLVGDEPAAWEAAGFRVVDDRVQLGSVTVRLAGHASGRGILAWTLNGVEPVEEIDGLTTAIADGPIEPDSRAVHPNGVVGIDHLVVTTPDVDRTVGVLDAFGIEARRARRVGPDDAPRQQVFFWIGDPILELVGPTVPQGTGPARFWGLACTCGDLDAAVSMLGERAGPVKHAVQPGRRIATLRTTALDVSVPVALMSPHVAPDGGPSGA